MFLVEGARVLISDLNNNCDFGELQLVAIICENEHASWSLVGIIVSFEIV